MRMPGRAALRAGQWAILRERASLAVRKERVGGVPARHATFYVDASTTARRGSDAVAAAGPFTIGASVARLRAAYHGRSASHRNGAPGRQPSIRSQTRSESMTQCK